MHLLAHVGDIYAHADDANRRLCNQVLFKAIYIDEDNNTRVGIGLSATGSPTSFCKLTPWVGPSKQDK